MVVTVYDVAQATGLSIASVSRALNGQTGVSAQTAERIRSTAVKLGYQPNEVARALVAKSTQTLALLVPDITNPFFPELVKGVQYAADARDHMLLLLDAPRTGERLDAALDGLRRKQVDGVLVVASELESSARDPFGTLPGVFLDRVGAATHSSVSIDQEAAAHQATAHLIAQGHRRIAHIMGPADLSVSRLRRAGWERACREAGLSAGDDLVFAGDFLEEGGYRAGEALWVRDPAITAVFASNDLSAIGLLAYCSAAGVRVPDELSVIGIDGIALSRFVAPVLTTIAQPIRELGIEACRLLLKAIDGEPAQDVVLPVSLSAGRSVARPREGSMT